MISFTHLSGGYPGKVVLHDLTARIPDGQIGVLLGPNGSGKSTLMKVLVGIAECSAGEIRLGDALLSELSVRERAQRLAYLAQERHIPHMRVASLVLHGRFPYLSYPRQYRKEDKEIADQAIRRAGIFNLRDHFLPSLSGGERQRAYLAMLLAQDTPMILMDEPTNFLDIHFQMEWVHLLRTLADEGKGILLSLHDLRLALQIADYCLLLDHGSLLAAEKPDDLYTSALLDQVFQVHLRRFSTENGWEYYYGRGEEQ